MLKQTSYEKYLAAVRKVHELLEREKRERVESKRIAEAIEAMGRAHVVYSAEVAERMKVILRRGGHFRIE